MIRHYTKKAILWAIQVIESYEYRNKDLNQSDSSKKIIQSLSIEGCEVMTDTGWQPFSSLHLTQPYDIWEIRTSSGKFLQCADNHRVFGKNYEEVFVKDLRAGDAIKTDSGEETIASITEKNVATSMFDLTVDSANHRYFTNGILSHNTVTSSIFIAWYVTFHSDRNVLVVS